MSWLYRRRADNGVSRLVRGDRVEHRLAKVEIRVEPQTAVTAGPLRRHDEFDSHQCRHVSGPDDRRRHVQLHHWTVEQVRPSTRLLMPWCLSGFAKYAQHINVFRMLRRAVVICSFFFLLTVSLTSARDFRPDRPFGFSARSLPDSLCKQYAQYLPNLPFLPDIRRLQ